MKQSLRRAIHGAAIVALAAATLSLAGCDGFFVKQTSGSGSGTTGTGNYAYVSNSATGTSYLNGYGLSGGTLVPATGSPYSLNYVPAAMAITTNNGFLYIASDPALNSDVGYIYGYSIGTGGALTIINSGLALESSNVAAMDVSADGKWLFVLNSTLTVNDAPTITEYAINSSNGGLTFTQQIQYSGAATGVIAPAGIKVAPSGNFVAVAISTGGLVTVPLSTAGALGTTETLYTPGSSATGVYAVTIDGSNNVYAAGTAGLQVFSATNQGILSSQPLSTSPTGTGPFSIALDGSNFVYMGAIATTGSVSASQIFNFSTTTSGSVAPLSPATTVAPTSLNTLAVDSTGKYLLGLGFGASSGLQMLSVGSTGGLTLTSSQATGTTAIPAVMALTH